MGFGQKSANNLFLSIKRNEGKLYFLVSVCVSVYVLPLALRAIQMNRKVKKRRKMSQDVRSNTVVHRTISVPHYSMLFYRLCNRFFSSLDSMLTLVKVSSTTRTQEHRTNCGTELGVNGMKLPKEIFYPMVFVIE